MTDIRENIINKLGQIMDDRGIKKVEIANYLNVSKGTVTNWFKKNNCIDIDNLFKLCEWWNISLDYFFPSEQEEYSSDEIRLIDLYRGAEDSARRIAVETLENHQKQDTERLATSAIS